MSGGRQAGSGPLLQTPLGLAKNSAYVHDANWDGGGKLDGATTARLNRSLAVLTEGADVAIVGRDSVALSQTLEITLTELSVSSAIGNLWEPAPSIQADMISSGDHPYRGNSTFEGGSVRTPTPELLVLQSVWLRGTGALVPGNPWAPRG